MTSPVNESRYRMVCSKVAIVIGAGYLIMAFFRGALVGKPEAWEWSQWAHLGAGVVGAALSGQLVFRALFERSIWRWKMFQGWLVIVPDMSGTWTGAMKSISFNDTFHKVVEIDHKFDHIIVKSSRQLPDGRRISTEFTIECNIQRDCVSNEVQIVIVYFNEPGIGDAKDFGGHPHHGCALLRLRNERMKRECWAIEGVYWTNKPWPPTSDRSGGTRGEMSLNWKATLKNFYRDETLQRTLYESTQ